MSVQDLDVDQLAAYLHLTPEKVRRLVDRGQLPGRRVGGEWRFSEAEIHAWLEERIGASDAEELTKVQKVVDRWSEQRVDTNSLAEMLPLEAIAVPLDARTRSSVVRRICSLAEATGLLWDKTRMVEAVLAREELHPTALDNGVAMLHPRRPQSSILGAPFLALGISSQPIAFGNREGNLTDVFFLICSTDDRVHLQVLAKLSHLLAQPEFLSELRAADGPQAAHELLRRYESELDDLHVP